MATLKICTESRTHWITNVRAITLARIFEVKNFDDPIRDSGEADGTVRGQEILPTDVFEFQPPKPDSGVVGDEWGTVLLVTIEGESGPTVRVVAPARSCFLMSDEGATVDRI